MSSLDDKLLAAHDAGDDWALVGLYTMAADQVNDIDAACFFLTQAYIFALEQDHPAQVPLHERLLQHGRV